MNTRREFLRGAIAAGAAVAAVGARSAAAEEDGRKNQSPRLRIAHLTDPQFGFGQKYKTASENYREDLSQFEQAIEAVNALKVDLALVTGDMTHVAEDLAKDWPRLVKAFEVPLLVAPGNHDLGKNNNATREGLDRFRSVFGYDRKAIDVRGWRVIAGNTLFLRTDDLADEKAAYEAWLKDELKKAKKYGGRVVIAGHHPPFVDLWNEKETYENFPRKLRDGRLRMYRNAGAKFFVAGHTHRFTVRGYGELTILNAETTSRNFDARCRGFRLFEVDESMNYTYNYIRV